jgi:hypothetical protein
MLTFWESRERMGIHRNLYRVRSWYLLGFMLVFRSYEQLTVNPSYALGSEIR